MEKSVRNAMSFLHVPAPGVFTFALSGLLVSDPNFTVGALDRSGSVPLIDPLNLYAPGPGDPALSLSPGEREELPIL